jgi:hypothetical protein
MHVLPLMFILIYCERYDATSERLKGSIQNLQVTCSYQVVCVFCPGSCLESADEGIGTCSTLGTKESLVR